MKTLTHRLFGRGRIPMPYRTQLESEGLVAMDEGIRSVLHNPVLKTPTLRSAGYWRIFTGAIALSQKRLMAFEGARKIIDLPLADPRLRQMRFEVAGPDRLRVVFDPALFHDDWSGVMDFTFRTPLAASFSTALTAAQA